MPKALTKIDIIDAVAAKNGFSRNAAQNVLEILMETIKSTLESGEDVLISGFGKFCVKTKDQRQGRNPATEKSMILRERKVVTFKCSGKLREKINRWPADNGHGSVVNVSGEPLLKFFHDEDGHRIAKI